MYFSVPMEAFTWVTLKRPAPVAAARARRWSLVHCILLELQRFRRLRRTAISSKPTRLSLTPSPPPVAPQPQPPPEAPMPGSHVHESVSMGSCTQPADGLQ